MGEDEQKTVKKKKRKRKVERKVAAHLAETMLTYEFGWLC